MHKRTKILLAFFVIVILVVLVYSLTQLAPEEKGTTTIGAIVILSGDAAAWGENAKQGIELALADNNDKTINIIFENSEGDNRKAISSYQKLTTIDKVDAIIGPLLQSEIAVVAPLVYQDQIPVVVPSYAPIQNRQNPRNPLMIWMDPTLEAQRMAEYVFNKGIKTVGVLGTLDSWENEISTAFAEKFASLGGTVVAKEILQTTATDTRTSIAKIMDKEPDAIFLGTYYQYISAIRSIRELNYEGKVYSIEVDSYLASETKSFSEEVVFIAPDFYTPAFVKRFEEKYGQKPGIPAGQAYDATMILLQLLKGTKDKAEVINRMEAFTTYDGVSGHIEITLDHKTFLPTAFFAVENGNIVKITE